MKIEQEVFGVKGFVKVKSKVGLGVGGSPMVVAESDGIVVVVRTLIVVGRMVVA